MGRITGIRERIVKWWQSYNLWVFVALIFMFIIVGWVAEHRSGAYRCLGIAATLLSIVLSIIVIVYAMAQNIKADIAQDRMERLVERVEDRIQVVGKDVRHIKDNVSNNPSMQVNDAGGQDKANTNIREVGIGKVYFSVLSTSDIARLFAYFLLKSNKLDKPLSINQFALIVDRGLTMPTSEVKTYVLGIVQGMACGLEGYLDIMEQKNVHLKKLPEHFEHHVKISTSWMNERNSSLAEFLREIDNIA